MRRLTLATVAIAFAALVTGCASNPGTPDASTTPPAPVESATTEPSVTPTTQLTEGDFTAGWIAGDTMIGVVTSGSSTCLPVGEATLDGDVVVVSLSEVDPSQPCTRDFVPRITAIGVPEGADVTQGVKLRVEYGENFKDITLPASGATIADPTNPGASAGAVGSGLVGLVTYGSSTCKPVVAMVQKSGAQINVALQPVDPNQPCTADYAPRVTPIEVEAAPGDMLTFTNEQGEAVTVPVIVAAG